MELPHNSSIVTAHVQPLPSNLIYNQLIPNRVLQERSSNPQYETFEANANSFYKYEPTSATENVFPHHMVSGVIASQPAIGTRSKSKAEIDRDFQSLYRMVHACESYQKYRANQSKEIRGPSHQKWPEHLERAFFRALVKFEPMGRRKQSYKNSKPLGRNECIAEAIEEWTHERVHRKQVSSHIQVLKEKVKDGPYGAEIMWWLDGKGSSGRRHGRYASDARVIKEATLQRMDSRNSYNAMSNSRNEYAFPGPPALPCPTSTLPSNAPEKHQNTLEPLVFDMYVQDGRYDPPRRLHTFTRFHKSTLQPPQQPDLFLETTPNWQAFFPHLTRIYQEEGGLHCDIIYADATLELMTQVLPPEASLSIQFDFTSDQNLSATHDWECRTRFYENDKPEITKEVMGNVTHYDDEDGQRWLHTVPFGSNWWAQKFSNLGKMLRDAAEVGKRSPSKDARDAMRQKESDIRRYIRHITAVQEILAVPKDVVQEPQRVALVYWKFKQANPGEGGAMKWRNLVPPCPKDESEHQMQDQSFVSTAYDTSMLGSVSTERYAYGLDDLSTMALADLGHDSGAADTSHHVDHTMTNADASLDLSDARSHPQQQQQPYNMHFNMPLNHSAAAMQRYPRQHPNPTPAASQHQPQQQLQQPQHQQHQQQQQSLAFQHDSQTHHAAVAEHHYTTRPPPPPVSAPPHPQDVSQQYGQPWPPSYNMLFNSGYGTSVSHGLPMQSLPVSSGSGGGNFAHHDALTPRSHRHSTRHSAPLQQQQQHHHHGRAEELGDAGETTPRDQRVPFDEGFALGAETQDGEDGHVHAGFHVRGGLLPSAIEG